MDIILSIASRERYLVEKTRVKNTIKNKYEVRGNREASKYQIESFRTETAPIQDI